MLLSGKRPFHHANRSEKKRMICHDPLHFPSSGWGQISQEAKDFCAALLMKRPADRMSASDAIRHAWIRQHSSVHAGESAAQVMLHHEDIFNSLQAYEHADSLTRLSLQV